MESYKSKWVIAIIGFILLCNTIRIAIAYDVIPVEDGGELSGTIKLRGELPQIMPLKVDRDPAYCGTTVPDNSLIINPANKGIENVVVSLEGIHQGKKHAPEILVLENTKCHFEPHILAGVVEDLLEIKNSDPVMHNTHLRLEGEGTILNMALPPGINPIRKSLTTAGMINANCDAHRFMKARILVFDHPYFSVTGKNGEFKISNIPPGHYKIKVWHEMLPVKEQEVTIAANGKTDLSLELNLK